MDSGTIITAIIFILVCSIPFIIMSMNAKKKERKFLRALFKIAENNNCKVSDHDFLGHAAIGIDEADNMVFFIKIVNHIEMAQQVSLSEIQKCRVTELARTGTDANGYFKFIDKLGLLFEDKDKNKDDALLEFYNVAYCSPTLSGELQLADKWCRILNDKIETSASQRKMVA